MSTPQPQPRVSILIPCHNAGEWVGEAIDSALAQTWPNREVIVWDDGSTDNSREVLDGYGSRIRVGSWENQGSNPTRNRLVREARGEWLQFLDADDYIEPDKIAGQLAALSRMPDADVIYSPITLQFHHPGGRIERREVPLPPGPHDPWLLMARWEMPGTVSPLIRKQAILDAGGWDDKQPICQEHELYFRLLKSGCQFHYSSSSGAVYRQWGTDTISRRDARRTRAARLRLLQEVERYLVDQSKLTREHLSALNQTRFESARMIWLQDPERAHRLIRSIHAKQPGFTPTGKMANTAYQILYRYVGFEAAEFAAWAKRGASHR